MCDVFDEQGPPEARNRLFQLIEETPQLDWCLLTKRPQRIQPVVEQQWGAPLPYNVWYGTSIESGSAAWRVRYLRELPIGNRTFVSFEPLIGPMSIQLEHIDWVIIGGETGPNGRPMHPDWVDDIHLQATALGVPFFFKHWGEWTTPVARAFTSRAEWLEHELSLQRTGYHQHLWQDGSVSYKVRKKKAGRLQLGRTWNEVPGASEEG
jgi:protein gp37